LSDHSVENTIKATNGMPETRTFQIYGMDCADCALTLEKGISRMEGIDSVSVSFSSEKMNVSGTASLQEIAARVHELGYEVKSSLDDAQSEGSETFSSNFWQFLLARPETRLVLLGALLAFPALVLGELAGIHNLAVNFFSIAALLAAGWPVYRSAWNALRISHQVNINVLMSIASIGAVAIGAVTEAAMVMVLFSLGEALEGFAAEKTRNSIRSLMEVMPEHASLIGRHGVPLERKIIPVKELLVGDHILVKPGDRIPMDGKVVSGNSSVNQASITGESRPVEVTQGSQVYASSINAEGTLEIEVTHLAQDNTISRLISMVQEAQDKKAPVQRFVDQFARYYTPLIVVISAMVAVIPPLLFSQPFLNPAPGVHGWLYRALALLVVGCPCALVISTPVSIISALSNAARQGILIKGGVHLETLSKIRAIAFDKTGTLTNGKPVVVSVRSTECLDHLHEIHAVSSSGNSRSPYCEGCKELVALAGSVEQYSEHPYAGAVYEEARSQDLVHRYPQAREVRALAGKGVTGWVDGHEVMVGSHQFFDDHFPHVEQHCNDANYDAAQGFTPLLVSKDDIYLGTISVADTLRDTSREALQMLNQLGMEKLIMLTGDHPDVARAIARNTSITDIKAGLLPAEKVNAVYSLQRKTGSIAMVGDGINDAPALAAADIGIAIGGAYGGTAQAMETADITLMSDDLRRLPFAVKLSRLAMRTVRANVAFAIAVKVLFFLLVLLGTGTMWMAVFADVGTSLLVTLNGLRLLNHRIPTVDESQFM
jgi:Cd2+/Zn2+-exporting ATPase